MSEFHLFEPEHRTKKSLDREPVIPLVFLCISFIAHLIAFFALNNHINASLPKNQFSGSDHDYLQVSLRDKKVQLLADHASDQLIPHTGDSSFENKASVRALTRETNAEVMVNIDEQDKVNIQIPKVSESNYLSAVDLDVQPIPVEPIVPRYPDLESQNGTSGYAILQLLIDESGSVQQANVIESSPSEAFGIAAIEAFKPARFIPGKKSELPVKCLIKIRVDFQNSPKSMNIPS